MIGSPPRSRIGVAPWAPLLLLALLAGCSPSRAPAPGPAAPSGPTGPVVPSGPPPVPPGPQPMPGLVVEWRIPGGAAPASLDPAAPGTVDPAATFEVRVAAPVRGARLVLLDAQDAMVPASSDAELGTTARFSLVPLEPLRPGSRYQLRLEGIDSRIVGSTTGWTFEPAAVPFTTTGEPPPRAPPRKAVKKRHR